MPHSTQTITAHNADMVDGRHYEDIRQAMVDDIHPIGDIKMTLINVNPSVRWPWTQWEAWGVGEVPVGVNTADADFNTPNKPGGAKTSQAPVSGATTTGGTAITVAQMPGHQHGTIQAPGWPSGTPTGFEWQITYHSGDTQFPYTPWSNITNGAGNNQAHTHPQVAHNHALQTIVQPYRTCYFWRRTS